MSTDDDEAVRRSLDGDLDAYAALVARYTAPAHRAAVMFGAGDDADDVVQEAFIKAYRHLAKFRRGEVFRPWLLQIVVNETRNLHRSRRRLDGLVLRASALTPSGVVAPDDPELTALSSERRSALLVAVRSLPEKYRQAVTCRYFLELSEAETAQVLGWPAGSVKSRTARALARLQQALGKEDRDG
ncbi:RNA polymerase sigma factor [Tenggerimyces flavus]|uniref:RNA polymerase sigma factor n=1 Tax=Tenggerimyces flavus TaxID=1708749 RepID=A0ABV7YAC2_9ACTN|nr:RNA polymerase sigma factor [Tenggerimyces flavus]MBM7785726.1 RNA polymerase sigma-70 factor (ECF subfamily) [Tenggerimyces flavus]